MRYILNLEIKLIELHDPDPPPEPHALQTFAQVADATPPHVLPFTPPAGIDFRKAIMVTVPNFAGLAKILEKFDQLVGEIELERA